MRINKNTVPILGLYTKPKIVSPKICPSLSLSHLFCMLHVYFSLFASFRRLMRSFTASLKLPSTAIASPGNAQVFKHPV